jgi:hypothetical protein
MENIRISDALQVLTPGAEWSIGNNSYSQLDWLDTEQTKPTEEEVVQKVAELTYQKEVEVYKEQRAAEYPSYADQFDQIYHEGVDSWKASIQEVKDKYPKATMDLDELQSRQDKAIFDLQTERYIKATERLSQYILLEGREEVRETIVIRTEEVFNEETGEIETNEITEEVITQTAIEPLEEFIEVTEFNEETMESTIVQIRNPLVVKDEEERTTAQLIVDNTPDTVKESYSSVLNPDRVIVQESEGPVNPIDVLE